MKRTVPRFSPTWTLGQASVSASVDTQHVVCHHYARDEWATVLIRVTDGQEMWRYPNSVGVGYGSGTVAVRVDREVHLLEAATGTLMDVMDFPGVRTVLLSDRTVLALCSSGILAVRNRASGRKVWSRSYDLPPTLQALAEVDGTVVVADREGIFGVDANNGEPRWEDPHYVHDLAVAQDVVIGTSLLGIRALAARDGAVLWSDNIETFACCDDLVNAIGSDQKGARYLTRSVRDGGVVTNLPISAPKRFERGSGQGVAAVWGDLVLVVTRSRMGGFMIDRRSGEFAGEVAFGSGITRAVVCGRHLLLSGHGVPLMCLAMKE